jgi:presenilin-like A22 family membrane protease
MKLHILLNAIGLFIGVVGAFFLAKAIISVSPSQIIEQTAPKIGFNSELVKSVSFQQANSLVGFSLILMSFVLQLIAIYLDERFITSNTVCIVAVLVVGMIIGAYKLSLSIGEKTRVDSIKIVFRKQKLLDAETEEWITKNCPELFGMPKRDNETFEEYKKRLSEYIKKY